MLYNVKFSIYNEFVNITSFNTLRIPTIDEVGKFDIRRDGTKIKVERGWFRKKWSLQL